MTEQVMKRCSRGEQCVHPDGCLLPATTEYFHRQAAAKDGLKPNCKACVKAQGRDYRERNKDTIKGRKREYFLRNRELILGKSREHYLLRAAERHRSYSREYRLRNRERASDAVKRWVKNHPDRVRRLSHIGNHRRRARTFHLPDTFSEEDWQRATEYFGDKCAACGKIGALAMDHWIPVTNPACPGNVPSNIVPLCHLNCNSSKFNRDPEDWLVWKFGAREAKEILARIEEYFEWVKRQG